MTGHFVHVGVTLSSRIAVAQGLYQVPAVPLDGFAFSDLANNSTRVMSLLGRQLYNRGGFDFLEEAMSELGMMYRIEIRFTLVRIKGRIDLRQRRGGGTQT